VDTLSPPGQSCSSVNLITVDNTKQLYNLIILATSRSVLCTYILENTGRRKYQLISVGGKSERGKKNK
jgi:hypothetical protein